MNISKLMTFIFRNRTIFWDIPKRNRGQTKWDKGSIIYEFHCTFCSGTIYEFYCTMLVNFYFYPQYFQQKVFNFNKISGFQMNPVCINRLAIMLGHVW